MVTAVLGFIEQVGNMIKGIPKHSYHPSNHYNSVKLQRASTNMRHAGQPVAWFPGARNRREHLVHTVRTVCACAKSHGNLHTICYTKHALTKQSISDYLQSYALCEGVLKSKNAIALTATACITLFTWKVIVSTEWQASFSPER